MKKAGILFLFLVFILASGCIYKDAPVRQDGVSNTPTTTGSSVVFDENKTSGTTQTSSNVTTQSVPVSDEDIIKSYYAKIAKGNYEAAFDMKTKTTDYATFKSWYVNTIDASVSEMEKIGDHKYRFVAWMKDNKGLEEKYRVVMVVSNGFLDTKSSEKFWDNNTVEAFSVYESGHTTLMLKKNEDEREIIVLSRGETLKTPTVSDDKKTLIYAVEGSSGTKVHVYNIEQGREVDLLTYPTAYGFAAEGDYFYVCKTGRNGYGYFKAYNMPAYTLRYDFFEHNPTANLVKCGPYDNNDFYTLYYKWNYYYQGQGPYLGTMNTGYHFSLNKVD